MVGVPSACRQAPRQGVNIMTENPSYPETPDEATRRASSGEPTRVEPPLAAGATGPTASAASAPGPAQAASGPPAPGAAPSGGRAPGAGRPQPPPAPWGTGSPPPPGGRATGSRWRDWGPGGRGGLVIAALVGFLIGALLCGVAGAAFGLLANRGGIAGRGDDRPHMRQWQRERPGWQNGPMPRRGQGVPGYPQPSATAVPGPTG